MRRRVLEAGAQTLADYELLEMLLFLGVPRRDTKPLAKALLNEFGSLAGVLEASDQALINAGLSNSAIAPLRLPVHASLRLSGAESRARLHVGNWDQLLDYFDSTIDFSVAGQMRVLFLDSRNRLIADEPHDSGQDTGAIFCRDVLQRVLALHATAILCVRIRVPGIPLSRMAANDASLMKKLSSHAVSLSTILHDAMVMGKGEYFSLRQHNLI